MRKLVKHISILLSVVFLSACSFMPRLAIVKREDVIEKPAEEVLTPTVTLDAEETPQIEMAEPEVIDEGDVPVMAYVQEVPVEMETRFHYELLSDIQKYAYGELYNACREYQDTIIFNKKIMPEDVQIAIRAILRDYPEFEWIESTSIYYTNDGAATSVNVTHDDDIYQRMDDINAVANDIIAGMPRTSEYDEYKYIYDYIIRTTDYDTNNEADNQHISSVLLEHKSVCAGYAKTFHYLAHKAGLYSTYVVGTITRDGKTEDHAWNLIKIGDTYCWVDVTWGDPVFDGGEENVTNYNYFCIPDDLLIKEHELSHFLLDDKVYIRYPSCYSWDYEYYVRNNLFFDYYDSASFKQYLKEQMNLGETIIEVQFSDTKYLDEAIYDLITTRGIDDVVAVSNKKFKTYRYIKNDNLAILYLELYP